MDRRIEIERLRALLESIGEPRARRGCRHRLVDVLFIALVAMVSGADDAEAIEEFGDANEAWFREFLELQYGIPSQDTFLRLFAAIAPERFASVFRVWVSDLRETWHEGHVALDGKTLRSSFDKASGGKAIHMVSAWLAQDGLVLGQIKVAEKSNEITAIPELLRLLDVRGTTVTIDAMGCQHAIAEQIVASGANYVLAVKDNQPTLHDNLATFFQDAQRPQRPLDDPAPAIQSAHDIDAGHGRIEQRTCLLSRDLSWVEKRKDWKELNAIALVRSDRTDKATGKTSQEERLFIISHPTATAGDVLRIVREHWGIENQLHWVLDMAFGEDFSRTRAGHAAANFALVRHAAINLLRAAPGKKKSIALRPKRCGWDRDYLMTVLTGKEQL